MAGTQMASLGGLLGGLAANSGSQMTPAFQPMGGAGTGLSGGSGGGGNAQDGINQINEGAGVVSGAIGAATSALGGGGGGQTGPQFKKGGSASKKYTSGGKINLKACGVSTASAGKKNSGW
jgi:hypothetical protein